MSSIHVVKVKSNNKLYQIKIKLFIERYLLLKEIVYDTSLITNGIIPINLIDSIIKLLINNLVAMCDQVKGNFKLI